MTETRPTLTLDLRGADGNVFIVIGQARLLLSAEALEQFNHDTSAAREPGAGKQYKDILEIVNSYVRLIDTSGLYPEYAWNETAIMAAIDRLNEQLQTLPDTISCLVEGLSPEFDSSDCGPDNYLALIEGEIQRIEQESGSNEDGQRLLAMLLECVDALKSAGV